ncbi:MAG: ATP-binding protein [Nitrososphaera sp.]
MKSTTERMDIYFDRRAPSIVTELADYRNGYIDIRRRGGQIRCITDITRENLQYAKKLEGLVTELRHFSGLMGGVAVNEKEYMATTVLQEAKPLTQVIYSNVVEMVEQGQFIFDTLWNSSMPAFQRIKELEDGVRPEVIETIRDQSKLLRLARELLKSARNEILIILSSTGAFQRQKESGLVGLIEDVAASESVAVRVLAPGGKDIEQAAEIWAQCKTTSGSRMRGRIELRNINTALQTRISLLVVDKAQSLTAEFNDASHHAASPIGMGTYSNSKATVSSYSTIFEALWNQAELYEKLQVHSRMQKEFVDIAAHELRTPIQPILGMAEVLRQRLENTPDGDPERKMIDIIIRNANRLQQLQEDILDVTKIESNTLVLDREEFALNEAVSQVVSDIKNCTPERVSLRYSPNASPRVLADKGRLMQVISNIVHNAVKFTRRGRVQVTVKLDSGRAVVRVRDNGPGISDEIMPRLFTKFATTSQHGGTGLGLYIAKRIVEAHDGKIWAENNSGSRGATFGFSIPALKAGKG